MPLILKKFTDTSTLLLWRISESDEQLRMLVTRSDFESAAAFTAPKRRLERLAWRAALRTVEPLAEVGYDETGAPFLIGNSLNISVAHTEGLAVVMLSANRCAVDVERIGRDFGRVVSRFVSHAESQFTDAARPDFPTAVWCAKETMYKYSGRRELDLIRDLSIISSDLANGIIEGSVIGRKVNLTAIRQKDYIIVYTECGNE